MKVRIEQLNPTIGDIEGNRNLISGALERAEKTGADLLILPEMVLTGYPVQDLLETPSFREACYEANKKIIKKTRSTALLFGSFTENPSRFGRKMFNSALLCRDGKLLGRADKTLLPTYDIFDDLRYFEPGKEIHCLELDGIKLGVTICEDIWYNENEFQYHHYEVNPAAELKKLGARVIINISASPFTRNKHKSRLEMLKNHALELKLPLFYSNQTGAHTDVVFDGDSLAMRSDGSVVALTEPFLPGFVDVEWNPESGELEWIGRAHLDVEAPGHADEPGAAGGRMITNSPGDKEKTDEADRSGDTGTPNEADRPGKTGTPGEREHYKADEADGTSEPDLPGGDDEVESRVFKAIVTGIRDYFRKSGLETKAVLGLSGGIDSALVACLAVEALGRDRVVGLTMPAEISSPGSVDHSRELADNLGMNLNVVPIHSLYEEFNSILAPLFKDKEFGVMEENLQSRIRGSLLMAFSNKMGHLLLATGNKSELAVGYATLYGDMNGGLNPVGDLYKMEVYSLCRWLNRSYYRKEIIPGQIFNKPPSAELRPGQKDSDSLPDYEILDDILRRYIEFRQEADKIADEGGYSEEMVLDVLKRVDYNEFKRFQAPPILKLSAKSFGLGRRRPLAQGWTQNRLS